MAASLLLALNVAPRVIMEILGHSRISTTMDIYSHVVPSLKQEAAERMDQLLAGDNSNRTIVGQTVGQKSA
jgi:integrase